MGRLGRLGASRETLEASRGAQAASWGRLGAVFGSSSGPRRPSLGRLGAILEPSEAILGRLGASNGGRTKHSITPG